MNMKNIIELDNGFDYALKRFRWKKASTSTLIGWMGLPEIEYPTDNEGWAHCLTIPRVLNVENGQL